VALPLDPPVPNKESDDQDDDSGDDDFNSDQEEIFDIKEDIVYRVDVEGSLFDDKNNIWLVYHNTTLYSYY